MNGAAEIITLKDGLRVVLEDIPFVRSVAFGIWVKNGSRNESEATNGISHFIEHMLFKGTQKRNAKEIADTMDEIGGQVNAFTSKEYTCFYTRTLDSHFDIALDVLSDMFYNSNFDPAEIDKERNVILEEISMYEDTPDDLVHDALQFAVYKKGSLGQAVLGTPESIGGFDSRLFKSYMESHYIPQNIVISVAGNISGLNVLDKIRAAFEGKSASSETTEDKKQEYVPNFIKKSKDIEQVHLCVGFPGIPADTSKAFAMAAINAILGGGMSSRLFQKIREEHGLAYSVYSYHMGFIDTGLFAVYAGTNPHQAADVLGLILDEIEGLKTNKVSKPELSKTKEQMKSNYLLSLENVASRMSNIGRNLISLGRIITADELIQKIDAVDLDSFYSLYEEVFDIGKMSLAIVGHTGEEFHF